jgi:hypothetical protein
LGLGWGLAVGSTTCACLCLLLVSLLVYQTFLWHVIMEVDARRGHFAPHPDIHAKKWFMDDALHAHQSAHCHSDAKLHSPTVSQWTSTHVIYTHAYRHTHAHTHAHTHTGSHAGPFPFPAASHAPAAGACHPSWPPLRTPWGLRQQPKKSTNCQPVVCVCVLGGASLGAERGLLATERPRSEACVSSR